MLGLASYQSPTVKSLPFSRLTIQGYHIFACKYVCACMYILTHLIILFIVHTYINSSHHHSRHFLQASCIVPCRGFPCTYFLRTHIKGTHIKGTSTYMYAGTALPHNACTMYVAAFSRSIIPKWPALGSFHNLIGWLAFPLHGYCRIGSFRRLKVEEHVCSSDCWTCKAHFTAGEPQPQRTVYEFERN